MPLPANFILKKVQMKSIPAIAPMAIQFLPIGTVLILDWRNVYCHKLPLGWLQFDCIGPIHPLRCPPQSPANPVFTGLSSLSQGLGVAEWAILEHPDVKDRRFNGSALNLFQESKPLKKAKPSLYPCKSGLSWCFWPLLDC